MADKTARNARAAMKRRELMAPWCFVLREGAPTERVRRGVYRVRCTRPGFCAPYDPQSVFVYAQRKGRRWLIGFDPLEWGTPAIGRVQWTRGDGSMRSRTASDGL